MQSEAHNTAELQRETIRNLQEKYEQLQLRHSRSEEQRLELESLLSWERLQHNNLVESLQRQLEERDARILKLSKESTFIPLSNCSAERFGSFQTSFPD